MTPDKSDVLARLMEWMEASEVDDAHVVLRNAITEIAGLRARLDEHRLAIRRLAQQDATLSVQGGNVTVTLDAALTDEEREAVERAAQWMVQLAKDRGEIHSAGYFVDDADTLRGLLERLGAT
jgi:hypothetical protein